MVSPVDCRHSCCHELHTPSPRPACMLKPAALPQQTACWLQNFSAPQSEKPLPSCQLCTMVTQVGLARPNAHLHRPYRLCLSLHHYYRIVRGYNAAHREDVVVIYLVCL